MKIKQFLLVGLAILLLSISPSQAEDFAFQTDVQKVMKIIINSLYKAKEIFLRELISNASDALDKVRFLSLTDKSMMKDNEHMNITIQAIPSKQQLIISDSGIGMSKNDLMNNLGTIAKSGTSEFLKAMENSKDNLGLIGQFGVGFYSVYLVADTVQVVSKHPKDDKQWIWESNADSKYSIREDPEGNTLGRGTRIIIHLKNDAKEYLKEEKLKTLIQKYSQFIESPIYLQTIKTVTEEVPLSEEELAEQKKKEDESKKSDESKAKDDASDDKKEEKDEEMVIEKEDEKKEEKPKTKSVSKKVESWDQINVRKPIWLRSQSEITESEYNDFYQNYFSDWQDPMTKIHFKGEGGSDFKVLLYIPSKPPGSVLQLTPESGVRNVKLFVRRVFITDELLDFLPRYLSFVKGIVDSDDFPLNVSRETIQQTKLLRMIKNKVINKSIQMIRDIAANETRYEEFYKSYSGHIKLGVMDDTANRKKLAKLLRFHSTESTTKLTSLDDYLERMRKGQKAIYYITGTDLEQLRKSPYLETLVTRGYEVLLLDDSLDEYVTQSMTTYGDFKLQHIAKGKLEFGDEDESHKESEKELTDLFQPLTAWLTDLFKADVDSTVISNRLTTSPCALVAAEHGWSGRMASMMQAQKDLSSQSAMMYDFFSKQKKTLEINPKHPVIKALLAKVEDSKTNQDTQDLARSLLDMALLKGGYPIGDLDAVTKRIEKAVRLGLSVDLKEEAPVEVKKAPEVEPQKAVSDDEKEKEASVEEPVEEVELKDEATQNHDEL